jgi:putative phage-type endonuclease
MGSTPSGISGSRGAAVLGLSPWKTPFEVWQDILEERSPGFNAKHGYVYKPFEGNASTRWGLAFEDAIIQMAAPPIGDIFIKDREQEHNLANKKLSFITCHIDGMYDFKEPIIHEGKTTTPYAHKERWGEPGTDKIPIEYQIQVQHQMACSGAKECIISVLIFPRNPQDWENEGYQIIQEEDGRTFFIIAPEQKYGIGHVMFPVDWARNLNHMGLFHQYRVKANAELQEKMIDRYTKWWKKHVLKKTPPKPKTYNDIRCMIPSPSGTIVADDKLSRWFAEYKHIGSEISPVGRLGKRREQLKVLIMDHARKLDSVIDDESIDKFVFRDERGKKIGSYYKTKKGDMVFR